LVVREIVYLGGGVLAASITRWRNCQNFKGQLPTYDTALQPVKGKPLERVGRKTTGLRPVLWDMAAGLPGTHSASEGAVRCARPY
jgi:hypothetical protein